MPSLTWFAWVCQEPQFNNIDEVLYDDILEKDVKTFLPIITQQLN